jgi:tRNA (pseudouridine54-N1)-methyltransferase
MRTGGLAEVLANLLDAKLIYLREDGADIRGLGEDCQGGSSLSGEVACVLGDHTSMTPEEESLIEQAGAKVVSLGPTSLHADHCIVILNWLLDTNVLMQG